MRCDAGEIAVKNRILAGWLPLNATFRTPGQALDAAAGAGDKNLRSAIVHSRLTILHSPHSRLHPHFPPCQARSLVLRTLIVPAFAVAFPFVRRLTDIAALDCRN